MIQIKGTKGVFKMFAYIVLVIMMISGFLKIIDFLISLYTDNEQKEILNK